uniref:Uncharacterized protein n=1 Tax=Lepeophtheirus salmonis TaxID=72036 RepID=A0A0K2T0A4_LEPSM
MKRRARGEGESTAYGTTKAFNQVAYRGPTSSKA